MKPSLTISFAAAVLLIGMSVGTAHADGPFDGTWWFDATGSGRFDDNQRYQCPPIHLTLKVTNGQVSGSIEPRSDGQQVVDGYDSAAAPISGSIDNDGHVTMKWNDNIATGTASRHGLEVSWQGDCGERVANARPH